MGFFPYFYTVEITPKTLKIIGNRLRKIREEKRLSQTEVAQTMKMLPTQYNKIENGNVSPGLETLAKISDALDVSIDVIVFGHSKHKVKPEDASLSAKVERIEKLPPEERYIANEILNLVFARDTLKNLVDNFGTAPADVLKKFK